MARTKLTEEQKAIKAQEQEKERIEELRQRYIKECVDTIENIGQAPNKRKIFTLGENVQVSHGGFTSAKICDIIRQGIYEVHIKYTTTKPYSSEYADYEIKRIMGWWDIMKISTKECDIPIGKRIYINFHQQSIYSLLNKYFNDRGIDMNPTYQRGIVWTDKQREELLDSIFNRIDIGKFVFIQNKYVPGGYSWTVLDGKQKINALVDFYQDKFPYKGYYYSELGFERQHLITDHSISVGMLDESYADENTILEYFIRLNSTGTPMDKKHLEFVKTLIN